MHEFDPVRAARENLASLTDVLTTIRRREEAAELAMAGYEGELNALRKVRGYCQGEVDRAQAHLLVLMEEASKEQNG